MEDSFSKRHGYRRPNPEITIREAAPEELRMAIIQIACDLGLKPSQIRETLCKVLLRAPDRNNWSEYPNVWDEVKDFMENAPWFKVYDISEELVKALGPPISRQYYGTEPQRKFETQLNEVFCELGIGWQMVGGQIQTRGTEVFEASVKKAKALLVESGRPTAESDSEKLSEIYLEDLNLILQVPFSMQWLLSNVWRGMFVNNLLAPLAIFYKRRHRSWEFQNL